MEYDPKEAFIPAAPHIPRSIGKTADMVYRQMEAASLTNMELASQIGGGDKSDISAAKITDLGDYLREGDVAAKMPETPAASGQGGFQPLNGMTGAQYAAATGNGAFPHAGEMMRRDVTSHHLQMARFVETTGRIAKSK